MNIVRIYIHCFMCKEFKACKRRYTPDDPKEIYTEMENGVDKDGEPILMFTEPQQCKKLFKTSNS